MREIQVWSLGWEDLLEKTLESPFNCKKIKSVHSKGKQPWIFTGRTDGETEAPTLWSPDAKSRLIGKDPDAGKDWGQEEKGATEDEMAGWHYRLNGHEFEQTLGEVNDREAWCAAVHGFAKSRTWLCDWTTPWVCKESDMTLWLNNGSINRWMERKWEKYYTAMKKGENLVICNLDGLKGIMLSEICQTKKDKYHMNSFNMWKVKKRITKKTPNPPTKVTGKEKRLVVVRGRRWNRSKSTKQ